MAPRSTPPPPALAPAPGSRRTPELNRLTQSNLEVAQEVEREARAALERLESQQRKGEGVTAEQLRQARMDVSATANIRAMAQANIAYEPADDVEVARIKARQLALQDGSAGGIPPRLREQYRLAAARRRGQ